MPLTEERLRQAAIKAGIKASTKKDHLLTASELLELKIQVVRPYVRIGFGVAGVLILIAAWIQWPVNSTLGLTLEWIFGGVFASFAIFGVRRTFSELASNSADLIGSVIDGIASALSS